MPSLSPPGVPGITPRWTSSAKIGVGTAMSGDSSVWFTLSHGIINEVYFPRIDIANIRDMGLIVTKGSDFFSEEKRHAIHDYATLEEGIPAYQLINSCPEGRYRIIKTVITDCHRNVLLQRIVFEPLKGSLEDYHLYALLAPHIYNAGMGNDGWAGDYKGYPMLMAERRGINLAFACSTPFLKMTCGYVGVSDAWQDLSEHKQLLHLYPEARNGNIALAGEIDLRASGGTFVLALGFGHHGDDASLQTRAALLRDFDGALEEYLEAWRAVQKRFMPLQLVDKEGGKLFRMSTAVLKVHQGKHFTGSVIASLSIPWGFAKGDNDLGGYHLIWPRDQVATAIAFTAAGDFESARQVLLFLMCTQEADGHWVQCMWEDGSPYWSGRQMDETALPILLADRLIRAGHLQGLDPLPMIQRAASFLVRYGPMTQQDRWEEEGGYTPFTLALEIAALLAAADHLERAGNGADAAYLRLVADDWNARIEKWLYVKDTELAKRLKIEGYYVRITPPEAAESGPAGWTLYLKNRPEGKNRAPCADIVSVDALALVRYGLRSPHDPKILNTLKAIDALLKTETMRGPLWHRFVHDGYGEHENGDPFNGTGIGRGWPLLTGERAHYELAAGNVEGARERLQEMARFAGVGGLLPEQIWDGPDLPEKRLYNGHSSGAAKPFVWAHAEYITLLRSLKDQQVFDRPLACAKRYLEESHPPTHAVWSWHHRIRSAPVGVMLRVQADQPAKLHWSQDGWKTVRDTELKPTAGLGVYYADLPVDQEPEGTQVVFTFFWTAKGQWQGADQMVTLS